LTERRRYSSGTRWEPVVGYCRAVRAGPHVYVAGTTSTDKDGELVHAGDAYRQTVRVIENVRAGLQALGADLADVVRTRVYVTDMEQWEAVGKAHAEFFREFPPACTMVEVSRLALPEMLVEMEVEAYSPPDD
jgi:enamine deaminase RidA (YjgF/YER057c/UK114 family)